MPNDPTDADALRADQLDALNRMVGEILPDNGFYRSRLETRESPVYTDLDDFRSSCPFTTKADLVADQDAHPPYGTNLTYPIDRYTRIHQTSGTTGRPLRWLDTPESWSWMLDCKSRIYEVAGIGPGDRVFFPFSFGPFLGFWLAFEAATRARHLAFPGGGLGSAARLRAIVDQAIVAVCCTPTYAIRLAQVAEDEGIDLSRSPVRALIVGGEPGGSALPVASRIESQWPGARVYDHHGMTEIGSVTSACPERPGILHVIESAFIAEVLDPDTLVPVESGSTGELVLTNLGRWGSPLLRYRTGDLVRPEAPGPCACGSHELALAGGIIGRLDDMVVVRGVNVYPSAVEDVLRRFDQIDEYRVEIREVRGMTELSLQLELRPESGPPSDVLDRVRAAVKDALQLTMPVTVVPPDSLPRHEMKAKRWVRV